MSDSPNEIGAVNLALNADEALVLHAIVHRFSETDRLTIEHPGEAQALWNLCCLLEKQAKGWSNDYAADLAAARRRLASESD